jgi:purine-binding chemotaxis protein CheW
MANEKEKGRSMDLLQLVSFNIGNEEFAVDILKVQEINRMADITRVPKSPPFVEGVINLRGKVIPIVDLRKRFNLEERKATKETRIIVVDMDGKVVGLIVDSVSEVLRLPADTIEPPPPIVAGIESEYIKGVGKLDDRLLILLDLNKIFSSEERKLLSKA